jgi:hypothetical protein
MKCPATVKCPANVKCPAMQGLENPSKISGSQMYKLLKPL